MRLCRLVENARARRSGFEDARSIQTPQAYYTDLADDDSHPLVAQHVDDGGLEDEMSADVMRPSFTST
jgi:hypothetical protein